MNKLITKILTPALLIILASNIFILLVSVLNHLDEGSHNQLIVMLLISIILVIALAAFILYKIVKKITTPITLIVQELEQFQHGNFSSDFNASSNIEELETLIASIKMTKGYIKDLILDTARGCDEISKGNFDVAPQMEYLGEWTLVRDAMVNILTNLSNTIQKVDETAEQVAVNANSFALSSQSLAQGSIEQASSIEELSASLVDVSATVKENSQSIVSTNELVEDVNNKILKNNEQMKAMSSAMVEIKDATINIGQIIKTIEDIAFQTNILALNAAVEAARAGNAGKGFAVVADEVRNLASKSAEAAQNTHSIIDRSVKAVDKGTGLTDITAKLLDEVVTEMQTVSENIVKITETTTSQATAIEQINEGLEQVAEVVQHNSATAEESAAGSEELSAQAVLQKQLVSQFKLFQGLNF